MFIAGKYGKAPQLPQCPGFEGCGIVEESGGGLKGRLFTGKRVCVLNKAGGNWSEHAIVPASDLIPVGRALSDQQAATFFVNPGSAYVMTRRVLNIPAGDWLLQTAAGSVLGKMVARLGTEFRFRTINVVRNDRHVDALKAAGAHEVIVWDGDKDTPQQLQSQVAAITGQSGLRHAIDPVGGSTGSAVIGCLTHGARMLCYGTLSWEPLQFSPRTLMVQAAKIEGFWLGNYMQSIRLPSKLRLIRRLNSLIARGVLHTEIVGEFSLDQISDAIECARSTDGKTLLRIG